MSFIEPQETPEYKAQVHLQKEALEDGVDVGDEVTASSATTGFNPIPYEEGTPTQVSPTDFREGNIVPEGSEVAEWKQDSEVAKAYAESTQELQLGAGPYRAVRAGWANGVFL